MPWVGILGFSIGAMLATALWATRADSLNAEQPYVEKSRCTAGQVEVLIEEPDDVQRWYITAAPCEASK